MGDPWGVRGEAGGAAGLPGSDPWTIRQVAPRAGEASVSPSKRSLGDRFRDNVEEGRRHSLFGAAADAWSANTVGAMPGDNGAAARNQERLRDEATAYEMRSEADPWHKAPGGVPGKVAAGGATLGGMIAGGLGSPESWIGPGKNAVARIVANAGINAGTDAGVQTIQREAGLRDGYDPWQTVGAGGLGAITQGGFEVAPAAVRTATRLATRSGRAVSDFVDQTIERFRKPAQATPEVDAWGVAAVTEPAPAKMRPAANKPRNTTVDADPWGVGNVAPDRPSPVAELIRGEAARQGVDGDAAVAIAKLESKLNPAAQNPKSSAAGVFQFTDDTWNGMGGGDKLDPALNVQRGVELLRQNGAKLSDTLGRQPEAWELYLAHQQGATGASALLSNPDVRAIDALKAAGVSPKRARAAILLNGGSPDMTAGQFAAQWRDRFAAEGVLTGAPSFTHEATAEPSAGALARDTGELAPIGGETQVSDDADDLLRRTLWRQSPEDIDRLYAEAETRDWDDLVRAFGSEEEARAFNALEKRRHSQDPQTSDHAAAEFEARYGKLTPEQERLVYGVGDTRPQIDELRAIRDELELGRGLGEYDQRQLLEAMGLAVRDLRDVDRLQRVLADRGTPHEQAAALRMKLVFDEMTKRGMRMDEANLGGIVDRLVQRGYGKPADVAEIVGGFARDLEGLRAQPRPDALLELPAPAPRAVEAPTADAPRVRELSDADVFGGGERLGAIDLSAYGEQLNPSGNIGGLREAPKPGAIGKEEGSPDFAGETIPQIADRLRRALGITQRQGRMTLKGGAVGEYDPQSAVIRTKAVQELDVLSHEATHALEHKAGPALKAALAQHAAPLGKLAYPGANPKHIREEGFAEFGRWYFTNPEHARRIAPEFFDAFEAALAKDDPRLAADLKAIQGAYQTLLGSASLDVAAASVAHTGRPGLVGRVRKTLKENGLGGAVVDLADLAYTSFVDDLNPIAKAVRKLQQVYAENRGERIDLEVAKNPYALARLTRDAYAAGHLDIMEGVVPYHGVDPEGPSLSDALETALGARAYGKWSETELNRFDAYLISRRMVHEWDRYTKGDLPRPPDGNTREFHAKVIEDGERLHPTFKDAADLIYKWNEALWRKEFEGGLITRESYEHGLTAHPDYVPLLRDMSDKGQVGGSRRPRGAMQFAGGVKAFEGSTRAVISPLSSMMRRAYELNALLKRNDAIKALDDLAQAAGAGAGAIVERLPQHEIEALNVDARQAVARAAEAAGFSERDVTTLAEAVETALQGDTMATLFRRREVSPRKGENIVFAWRNGEKQPLLLADGDFGRDLYTALTGMNRDLQNVVVDVMAAGTQLLRYGVTLSPEFMSRNFVRDQMATWINTDVGFIPGVSAVRGMLSELRQDSTAKRYAMAGGIKGGANVAATRRPFPRDDKEAFAQLQHLRKKGYRIKRFASWRGLAELTDLSETSSRLGVFEGAFRKAKKRGLNDYDAVLEAAFTSRDYLDFGRHGSRMMSAVRLVTFLNASLQSLDKSLRVLGGWGQLKNVVAPYFGKAPATAGERRAFTHAAKATAKIAALGAFGLGLRMLYADDPEYEEIGDQLRATHWIFKAAGHWIFIPKPFELATPSNILERAFEANALKDPTAPERLLSDFAHTIAPPHEIPSVAVPFQVARNRDRLGRPIVPDHLRGTVDPALQFNAYTSELSKFLGSRLDVSPAVIDHAIVGFGGSMGRYVLQASNLAMEKATGKPATEAGPEDMFLSRGFVRDVTRGSTSQKEFWDRMARTDGEMTQAEGTFRALFKDGKDAEAAAYLNELDAPTRAFVRAKVFSPPGLSVIHPLVRAQAATGVIGDLRSTVRDGTLTDMRGEPINLTPAQRRQVDNAMAELAMVEMRNALIAVGAEGWEGKQMLSRSEAMDRLRRANSALPGVVRGTMLEQKVLPASIASRAWEIRRPELEKSVDPEQMALLTTRKRLQSSDRTDRRREAITVGRQRRITDNAPRLAPQMGVQ